MPWIWGTKATRISAADAGAAKARVAVSNPSAAVGIDLIEFDSHDGWRALFRHQEAKARTSLAPVIRPMISSGVVLRVSRTAMQRPWRMTEMRSETAKTSWML